MKKIICAAVLAAAAVPSMAMAQEGPTEFKGFYVGAVAGYDHVRVGDSTGRASKDGFTYGGIVGYDINVGHGGVLGLEAEIDGSTTKASATDVFATGDSLTAKAGRDIYIGARAGVAVVPSTLLYVKGGYANGRVNLTYNDGLGHTVSDGENRGGWRLGAGVEQSFGRLGARLEYRYTDYSDFRVDNVSTGIDAKRHQVVASLLARF